jgi:hypothetical protein
MKKIVYMLLVIVIMMCYLASCGNQSLGLGNFTFEHIHFSDAIGGHCATIEKWYDNSEGIEVKTKEFGSMYLSEGSYILIEDGTHCPYCSK